MSGFFNSFHRNTLEPLISLFINSSEKEHLWVSLVAQMAKCLPITWDIGIRCLGWEDPLQKEMATHSSILAWRIP